MALAAERALGEVPAAGPLASDRAARALGGGRLVRDDGGMTGTGRSLARIERGDLLRLAALAAECNGRPSDQLAAFLGRAPRE